MNHPKMKYVYVGIDSHKDTHCAVVLNCFFEKLGEITFNNCPNEFDRFVEDINKFKLEGTRLAFGLEDISAYGRSLTAFLTRKKYIVKHTNASLVANERKSQNALHKTDSFDAECAARVLLNRFDQLPSADIQDKYWVLAQLVTRRKALVKSNIALKNQLQTHLTSHYPSYRKFFTIIDCKSALAFYEKYPSPSKLKETTLQELDNFFKEITNNRNYRGKAARILEYVSIDGVTETEYQEVRDMAVKSTISQLNSNTKQVKSIDIILEDFIEKFDYKLQSMKGIDTVTAAYLIAEIGDISRFPTSAKLARYAGIAPVTYSSGKTDVQYANERGNRTLNSIFFRIAVSLTMTAGKNKVIINPYFYDYCNKKINEGKN